MKAAAVVDAFLIDLVPAHLDRLIWVVLQKRP